MRDIHSAISLATLIAAAALDADNVPLAVDLKDFDAAEILLAIGAGGITFNGTNKIEFKLTHSDDDAAYTAVTAADMLGGLAVGEGGIIKALTSAHATGGSYRFGYKGGKRYLKLLADFSGTHGTGTPIAAMVIRGHPDLAPVPEQV